MVACSQRRDGRDAEQERKQAHRDLKIILHTNSTSRLFLDTNLIGLENTELEKLERHDVNAMLQ